MEPNDYDVLTPIENLTITSLKLLGYDEFDIPKDMKIQLSPELFRKANTKALESILYFLLTKLTTQDQMSSFVFCWPPRTPDMKREYKESSYRLLLDLQDSRVIPENTLLGKSVLDMAQGERVWVLLKAVSDSALSNSLKQEMSVKLPNFPLANEYILNPNNATRSTVLRMKKAMVILIKKYMTEFNAHARKVSLNQNAWVDHASKLTLMHKTLRNQLDSLKQKKIKQNPSEQLVEKLAALDRVPQIDMMKYIWKNISDIDSKSSERKGIYAVSRLSDPKYEKKVLEIKNSGKIKVENIIKTWGGELQAAAEQLASQNSDENAQGLKPFITQISKLLEHKQAHLAKLNELKGTNLQIESEIERMKKSISSYKSNLYL
ncbi:unnamed protein product [Blepharisma stoltei]|uniref:HAUS augmin-like complex subunit 6 N-terminal domain-containing protein n=1 Tax=Blepharisma stoltei TaxID=1481888 RepID=A0AAU9J8P2_9CILI|nr:unnamed protein product [Blepharisma stoltei]